MAFVNPTYLWALLGLVIPLAIHLWSNKTGKTIKVGSIQLFQESESSKSSSFKLNEYLLLGLRSLAIIVLVMILAQPILKENAERTALTYIVEPSLFSSDQFRAVIDTLQTDDELRLLQPEFPPIEEIDLAQQKMSTPNYWQLAQAMEQLNTDSIVVFSSAFYSGLTGKRPTLAKNIEWIVVNPTQNEKTDIPVLAYDQTDQVDIVLAASNDHQLTFNTVSINKNSEVININSTNDSILVQNYDHSLPLLKQPELEIGIYYDESFSNQLYFMKSTLNAIAKYSNVLISIIDKQPNEVVTENHDFIIWLSESNYDSSTTPALVYRDNEMATTLIEKGHGNNHYILTRKLNAHNIVEEHFTQQLLQILILKSVDEDQLALLDKRVVSKAEFSTNFTANDEVLNVHGSKNLTHWFWFLLVPLIMVERYFANQRKQ